MELDEEMDAEAMAKAKDEIFAILVKLGMAERTNLAVFICAYHLGFIHSEFMPMMLGDIQQTAASVRNRLFKHCEEAEKNTR